MSELVDAEHLDTEFGGTYNLEYDYASYWPTLTKFCNLVSQIPFPSNLWCSLFQADHQAPDGTRKTEDGEEWIPPLGNGIKAALEGHLPHKDAVTTGHTTQDPEEAIMPHGEINLPSKLRSRANILKSSKTNSTPASPRTAGDSSGLVGATSKLSMTENVPEKETIPGPPVGELVFDHPPNQEEKEVAKAIMDGEHK